MVDEKRTIDDGQLRPATEHLSRTYAGEDGEFSEEEVLEAVSDAAAELSDAPVQAFVPLIAENKARGVLHDEAERRESEGS